MSEGPNGQRALAPLIENPPAHLEHRSDLFLDHRNERTAHHCRGTTVWVKYGV